MKHTFQEINDKFTLFADHITEMVGKWYFTFLSAITLILWVGYGVFVLNHQITDWFTSTAWNFPLNTITTVGEWFLERINRIEEQNTELLKLF